MIKSLLRSWHQLPWSTRAYIYIFWMSLFFSNFAFTAHKMCNPAGGYFNHFLFETMLSTGWFFIGGLGLLNFLDTKVINRMSLLLKVASCAVVMCLGPLGFIIAYSAPRNEDNG